MSSFAVHAAGSSDLETVVALRLALLREQCSNPLFSRLHPDVESRARKMFAGHIAATDQIIFLAERDAAAVGIVRCVHARGSPLLLPEEYGYISSAYVTPDARGGGVLKALMREGFRWLRGRGLTEARLYVSLDNEETLAVWDSLGFEPVEQLRIRRLNGVDAEY